MSGSTWKQEPGLLVYTLIPNFNFAPEKWTTHRDSTSLLSLNWPLQFLRPTESCHLPLFLIPNVHVQVKDVMKDVMAGLQQTNSEKILLSWVRQNTRQYPQVSSFPENGQIKVFYIWISQVLLCQLCPDQTFEKYKGLCEKLKRNLWKSLFLTTGVY